MTNFIIYQSFRYFTFILFNLLLFSCYFLVVFNNFFTIPVVIEHARLELTLIIPRGAPITVANDAIEMLPVVEDIKINDLSIYLLSLLLISCLSLISSIK